MTKTIMLKEYSILGVFLIGLAHVLEPCEDKAVVSVYVAWAGENFRQTLKLILMYGMGMLLINVVIGFIISFFGARYLANTNWQNYLKTGAGIFTIIFGLLIIEHTHLFGKHCLLEEHQKKINIKGEKSILLFGLLRGLPLCPVEIAVMLWAASVGSVFYGTLLVFFFSLGTAISLIPFGLGAKGIFAFLNKKANEKVKIIIQLAVGLVMITTGIMTIFY